MIVAAYPKEGFASLTQAARFLAVSKTTMYRHVHSGKVPHTVIGGLVRIPWESLHKIVALAK